MEGAIEKGYQTCYSDIHRQSWSFKAYVHLKVDSPRQLKCPQFLNSLSQWVSQKLRNRERIKIFGSKQQPNGNQISQEIKHRISDSQLEALNTSDLSPRYLSTRHATHENRRIELLNK